MNLVIAFLNAGLAGEERHRRHLLKVVAIERWGSPNELTQTPGGTE